jgi:hypothetical protein
MTVRRLRASCICGQLAVHAEGEPDRVGLCHCLDCRKASGSPFGAFAIYPAERVEVAGRLQSWADRNTQRCFCPTCGSTVFSRTADEIEIGLGAFDEPNLFEPTYELWVVRREHWLKTEHMASFTRNREGPT